jgi:putative transcription factor
MPECNLCGQDFKELNKAEVEGTVIDVCNNCLRFGRKVDVPRQTYKINRKIEFKSLEQEDLMIASGYGEKMKKARETLGLTRIELASKMNEKQSVIKRLEEEKMEPDEKLMRRIEKLLGINLSEKYQELKMDRKKEKPRLTVGDVVKVD